MSTTAYDAIRSAVAEAESNADREYRELGVSLRVANEERKRLEELAEAQYFVLMTYCGSETEVDRLVNAALDFYGHQRLQREAEEHAIADRVMGRAS